MVCSSSSHHRVHSFGPNVYTDGDPVSRNALLSHRLSEFHDGPFGLRERFAVIDAVIDIGLDNDPLRETLSRENATPIAEAHCVPF